MKKKISIFLLFLIAISGYSQNIQKKFIKGNISDKTSAVREASGSEGIWITRQALNFILDNKDLLGTDRELDGLAVATILSITPDYVSPLTEDEKIDLLNQLTKIFYSFYDSSTVSVAVISKVVNLDNYLPTKSFLNLLNNYLLENSPQTADSSLLGCVISSVGRIGDNVSFTILYNASNDYRYDVFSSEIEEALINLIPVSRNEVLQIVHSKDVIQINKILNLIQKNTQISKNYLSEIAENILNESILMIANSSDKKALVDLQIYSLQILNENKWTRASNSVLNFFEYAKFEYSDKTMNEENFVRVIDSLVNIAPIDSVNPLIKYLGELNSQVEREQNVSQEVALAVINTLGAIGDKSAFDSLLSVTYLDYTETVLSAARKALAGLRW